MVDISEVVDEQEQQVQPSQERLLDAEEIETVAKGVKRVSVRMHLEALAKKLRKESDALRRMENSKASLEKTTESKEEDPAAAPEHKAAAPPAPLEKTTESKADAAAAATAPPEHLAALSKEEKHAAAPATGKFVPIDRFSFDFGEYNSAFVTLYIPLPGVGSIAKSSVTCDFTKDTFDLIVRDLDNKSYRLFKDNLFKEIDPNKSTFRIKADKVVVKLAKKKGEYGSYDFWSKLTEPKGKKKKESGKENPQASIMELMRDMYDEGDDNMKKIIGETMMKQQRGELGKDSMGGAGGLGDMKLDDDF
mmetsp:Transcript_2104/g.4572  ORF Transcript_2104/g.4572 Transcript_2104/m.4572 type:complete len:306 (-) Transcript_2104:68-985(-)|eukprot:scaffold10825_cov153-Amphora_coffeaeformis.AAC.4